MNAADRLGKEPVSRLLFRFSLPAITGMVVNALYNIVDRIFVGQGVSEIALGGLSLAMPLMTLSFAFSMLFGIGSANMISMRLGQGRKDEAENALNHSLTLLVATGVLLMLMGLVFLEPLLSLMGAQEGSEAINYSRSYMRIILFGTPFMMTGFGMSHCTRAQGFPRISMVTMLLGAVMNMILDPIFIFGFGWGVEGAAWATIISQMISAAWIVSFNLGGKGVIHLKLGSFSPKVSVITQIMAFGSAQFLLQFIMAGVQLLINQSIGWYGAESLGIENGGDIALSVMTIIGSLTMFIMMPVFGINQGAQPILGYNYGAKQYGRVLKTYLLAIMAAATICVCGLTLGQLFPTALVRIFASAGSPELYGFALWAIRITFITLPLNGFQVISSNFFVVTGRPKMSIFLTTLRQFIAFIPCILIFGRFWGLYGIVLAAPVADTFAFILTGLMILFEFRKLRRKINESRHIAHQDNI